MRTKLEQQLLDHYACFQRERLWVDEHNEQDGFLSIVHPTYDTVPYTLCKGIAKFCKKNIDSENYPFIYVGAYVFNTHKL